MRSIRVDYCLVMLRTGRESNWQKLLNDHYCSAENSY